MTATIREYSRTTPCFLFRVSRYVKLNFCRGSVQKIAQDLSKALQTNPQDPRTFKATRTFFKQVNKKYKTDKKVEACFKQFLAAKLGIHAEAFDKNPGLETFARTTHLEKYLKIYNHTLKEEKDHNILILNNGAYTPWNQVKEAYDKDSFPESKPSVKWSYGQEGVQKKDMYSWSTLQPFTQRNPPGKYIFEYCVCCEDSSYRLHGDHTWFRLITPDGKVYSVGKNLEQKIDGAFGLPFRKKKGYLMSPDVSEFWPIPIHTLPVEITKEAFEKIKQSVEEDKQKEADMDFQVFKGNCTEYANFKAALAGLKLSTTRSVLRLITPIFLQNIYDFMNGVLPTLIMKVINIAGAIFFNTVLLILGNGAIDSKYKIKSRPHLKSICDIFKPSKLQFHPPTYLAQEVFKKIKKWRQEEAGEREYALPAKLETHNA